MPGKSGRTEFCRLLVVEDSEDRIALFQEWIPEQFRATYVKSAGRALKVLQMDAGRVYAGILLDHDLDQSVVAESELQLGGRHVVKQLVRVIDIDVPVLIHSVNKLGARAMENSLLEHGFDVTRIPFYNLDRQRLVRWLEGVHEEWLAQ